MMPILKAVPGLFVCLSVLNGMAQVTTVSSIPGITIGAGTSIVAASGTEFTTNTGIANLSKDTDLSNLILTMTNDKVETLFTAQLLTLGELTMNSTASVQIKGHWKVANNLTLTQGIILTTYSSAPTNATLLIYTGINDIAEGNAASFIDGRFFMRGSGPRTFPIGNADGYFPARLDDVREDDVVLGLEVIKGDPNLTGQLPVEVIDILKDHYWQLSVRGTGTYSGSPISISANNITSFLQTGERGGPAVVQQDSALDIKNLGGAVLNSFVIERTRASSNGKIYVIGKTKDITLNIGEVITPNSDGKNNVLTITNIELYPKNTVTLLDRYGVPVHSWTNFTNYSTGLAKQDDFDFSTLGMGNYICILDIEDPQSGKHTKKAVMITVLK